MSKSRLDQVLEQLNIKREKYVWWNDAQRVAVDIPAEMYSNNFNLLLKECEGGFESMSLRSSSRSFRKSKKGAPMQSEIDYGNEYQSVRTTPNPHILITQDTLCIFSLETEYDKMKLAEEQTQIIKK